MKKVLSGILSLVIIINTFSILAFNPITAEAATYAQELKAQGFPESYVNSLVALHNKYPNWIFKPLMTGLDWQTAVNGERSTHSKQLIEKYSSSNTAMFCNCSKCYRNGSYVIQEASNWVSASDYAVKYYMDPRNWLTEQYIFQFESTAYDGTQSKAGVEAILNGTWMYNSLISYKNSTGKVLKYDTTTKYSDAIMKAANDSGMSAYYLASKIRQEVGGSAATAGGASGTNSTYPGIYNYYNIMASTGALDGLRWAAEKAAPAGYYTNCVCNLRKEATTSSDLLVQLPSSTAVTIKSTTAKQADGYTWHNVTTAYGGKTYTGYLRSDLVTQKPATTPSYNRPWTSPYISIYNGAKWIKDNFGVQNTGYLQKFNVSPDSKNKYTHEYMANVAAAASESRTTYTAYKNANIIGMTKTFYIPVFNNMPLPVDQVTGLRYTGYNSAQIRVQWNKVSNVSGYELEKYDSAQWITVSNNIPATTDTYTVSNLTSGTKYQFRVRAYITSDGKKSYGSYSPVCVGYTLPSGVTLTTFSVMNETQINAAWKKATGNFTGYQIQWAKDSAFTNIVATTNITNANATNYVGSGFTKGTTYYIRMRTHNSIDGKDFYGSWSSTVAAKYIYVAPPSNLSSTEVTHKSVSLKWGTIANASGYIIQQYKNNTWVNIKTLTTNTDNYVVTGLPSDTQLQFRVRAYHNADNVSNYSTWSNTLSVRTEIDYTPDEVTDFKYTGYNSTQIRVQWNKVSNATGYILEVNNGNEWTTVSNNIPYSTNVYTVSGLTSGTKYQFRITAYRIVNGKTFINEQPASCVAYTLPSAVTLTTFSVMNETQINAAWKKPSGSLTGYQIQWAKDSAFTNLVATTSVTNINATNYVGNGFIKGTTYYIRVRTCNSIDGKYFYGSWSPTVAAKYIYVAAPTGLASDSVSTNSISLKWNKVSNATGYTIQQYKNGAWTNICTLTDNITSYTVTGLTSGTSYQFRVRANHNADNVCNYSGWSNSLTAKTGAQVNVAQVTGLKYTGYNSTQIRVQWNKVSGASGYELQKYDGNSWSTVAGSINSATNVYMVSSLTSGTKYQFRVRAYITNNGKNTYGSYSTACVAYTLPSAITLTTFSVMNETQINAAWKKPSGSLTGYQIQWAKDSAFTNLVAATSVTNINATNYVGNGFIKGTTYYIRVRTCNSIDGKSFYGSWSPTVAAKYIYVAAPTGLAADSVSANSISLKWNKVGNATGYTLQQYKNGAWTNICTLTDNTTSYTVTGLTSGTSYQFRVRANHNADNVCNYSGFSSGITVTTNK